MTYNFDPERWYENQRALLEHRRTRGEIDQTTFDEELERLGERYEEMLERQNAPFELPKGGTR